MLVISRTSFMDFLKILMNIKNQTGVIRQLYPFLY